MKLLILIIVLGFVSCQSQGPAQENIEYIIALAGEQFIINEPASIDRVVRKVIFFANEQIRCQSINHQPETSVQAKYNLKDYVSDWTGVSTWQTQIISAVYQSDKQKIFAMLTSGEIVEIDYKLNQDNGNLQQKSRYKMRDQASQWIEISLIADSVNLYGLYYGALRTINLSQNADWTWGETLTEGFVSRAINYDVSIYALTQKKLFVLYEGALMEEFDALENETFIDFDIDYHNLYILTTEALLIVDSTSFQDLGSIQLQYKQDAKKIRVKDGNVLIQFQRHGQVIVREHVIRDERLKKGVIHRQYEDINEMIIFDKMAIVVENFEFNLVQLQMQSESEIMPEDKQISFKYESIVDLKSIDDGKKGRDIFLMLVLPNSIELIQVRNKKPDFDLFQGGLSCSVVQWGEYKMLIRYDGFCHNQTVRQCSGLVTYYLNIRSNGKNQIMLWTDIVIMFCYPFVLVAGVYCYRLKKKRLLEEIKEQQDRISSRNDLKAIPVQKTQESQEVGNVQKTYEEINSQKS